MEKTQPRPQETAPTDSVTDRLRQDILSGTFPPGERLVELQLTKQYEVGRAAIRSAIVELDKEGLVTREANRGATVRKVSAEEAVQIYEARSALEGLLARHAAINATDQDIDLLRSIIIRMKEAADHNDPRAYSELNREFHREIRRASRHDFTSNLVLSLRNQAAHHPFRLAVVQGKPEDSLTEHEAIVEAIVEKNADAAEKAMIRHASTTIDLLRQWTEQTR
ncbi:MAG: GntR family transcriptional regulator [Myxococcota bacterium]